MENGNSNNVGTFMKKVCKVACYVTPILASYAARMNAPAERNSLTIGYDDVVNAILHSSMLSSDKCVAVEAIKRDGNEELYKAIIHIVRDSSMLTSYKIEMIKHLCDL